MDEHNLAIQRWGVRAWKDVFCFYRNFRIDGMWQKFTSSSHILFVPDHLIDSLCLEDLFALVRVLVPLNWWSGSNFKSENKL